MSTQRLPWIVIVLITVFSTTGCLYNNVREVAPNQSFNGLEHVIQTDNTTLNVVFVHGMGHHPFGEKSLLDYQAKIANELGFSEETSRNDVDWGAYCHAGYKDYIYFSEAEKTRLKARRDKNQAICPLRINHVIVGFIGWRQYRLPNDGKTLNLFELSWDRATELLQKTILELDDDYYETVELDDDLNPVSGGRDRESDRAWLNHLLKKFVNQNLGDPAIYLGSYGDSIRRVVAEGLSRIAAAAGTNGKHDYSIVSDSLGSRVVFDALGCALDRNAVSGANGESSCEYLLTKTKFSAVMLNPLSTMANNTTQVFMNANQLPFLALSNVRPPNENEQEKDWLNRFPCESGGPGLARYLQGRKLFNEPVQIVAFTDPNDALSYHLTDRFRKKCTHLGGNGYRPVYFINVRISNVKWDFGIFANPLKAHSGGFRTNDEALNLLIHGYKAD